MRLTPCLKDTSDPRLVRLELPVSEDGRLLLRRLDPRLAVAPPAVAGKQRLAQRGEDVPVGIERVEVAVGYAALQMRLEVLEVFRLAGIDVARKVEVVVVGRIGDLGHRHHAGITRHFGLPVEHVDDEVNVLRAQAVLVSVLEEALARVDHEDAAAGVGVLLVEDQDAGGNAGAVEEVGGQAG